jgi:2-polyprenyl-3-methyl-5-hydroxy-6-metoxy-1,4-benzoquinol methylase
VEHLTACIGCGAPSAGARAVHLRRDDALVRCPSCGLLYANPQYTDAELDELYRTLYYDEHKNFESDFREQDFRATRALYETGIDHLLARYPRLAGGRAFDFGCGVGFFLVACRDRGLTVSGVDFSDVAVRYARERFALDVHADPERTIRALPSGSFDLVTAWQVVEHLRRPRAILTELVRLLAPGGVLAVAVPHVGALRYRLDGARWFNLQNLTHLAFFGRENLSALLADLGLVHLHRAVLWGGLADARPAARVALWLARALNLGNELRLYGEKPA